MIKLQRIRLNHKVTGALWEQKGDLWQSHFCRLLKPVILFKGQPLIWQVWVSVRKEGQSSSAWGGACAEKLRGRAPAGGREEPRWGWGVGWCVRNGKRSEQARETDGRRLSPCRPSSFTAAQHGGYPDPRPHALFRPVVNLGKDEVGGETQQRAKHIQLKGREFHVHIWWNFILFLSMTARKMLTLIGLLITNTEYYARKRMVWNKCLFIKTLMRIPTFLSLVLVYYHQKPYAVRRKR